MSDLLNKFCSTTLNRRQFLKDSAVATAALAGAAALTGCNKDNDLAASAPSEDASGTVEHTPITNPEEGGRSEEHTSELQSPS